MTLEQYRTVIHNQHEWTNRALKNRCRDRVTLGKFTKKPLSSVRPAWRGKHIFYAKRNHRRAQAKASRCVPTNPTAIVRYVFPGYAEDEALRVAGCESTGTPYVLDPRAKNPYSSASGLFQLLDTWWAGRFDPFDSLANTRAAYRLWRASEHSFAQHWAASIGCWG